MVLRTEHVTSTGRVAVTDALALGAGEQHHHIGHRSPHVLLRVVEGIEGEVEVTCDLQPRFEYGLTVPVWMDAGLGLRSTGGASTLVLSSDVDLVASAGGVATSVRVCAGERVRFALQLGSAWDDEVDHPATGTTATRGSATPSAPSGWSSAWR